MTEKRARVTQIQVTTAYYVTPSGALYTSADQAYAHLAAWLIVNRDVARGERTYIGPPKLVSRLARWLAWADSVEAPATVRRVFQYEHRGGACSTHGLAPHWRVKGAGGRWTCMECEPHP